MRLFFGFLLCGCAPVLSHFSIKVHYFLCLTHGSLTLTLNLFRNKKTFLSIFLWGILIIVQVRGKPKLVMTNVNVKRKTQKFQISRAEKKTSLPSAMICQHEERLHCHSCKFLWIANIYEHQIFLKLDAFYLLRRRFHIAQVLKLLQAWCTIYDPCEALIVFDRVNKC